MSVTARAPYRSAQQPGNHGFGALIRAEWTKFRSVRGWMIAMAAAGVLIVLFSLLNGVGSHSSFCPSGPASCTVGHPQVSLGPGGEPVDDSYEFVHQPLAGNGSITVEITSLTGLVGNGDRIEVGAPLANATPGLEPWAKAGLIVTASTAQGSPYAAVMASGGNGIRFQWDYTHDVAGLPGLPSATSPRWLRLTRSGETVTGEASTDGTHWTHVGTAQLAGLPGTVQAGLFVTSPMGQVSTRHLLVITSHPEPSRATAVFGNVSLGGQWPAGAWSGENVGEGLGPDSGAGTSSYQRVGDTFTVSGSGNIAPTVDRGPGRLGDILGGAFIALIVAMVVGTLFMTTELRRGLIRTTLAASPRRGRVLGAKAIVIATATFVSALAGASIGVPLGEKILRANGNYIPAVSLVTGLRVIVGTAAVLAIASVLALAIATILRRSAAAVTTAIVLTLLSMILTTSGALPTGVSQWVLRTFPAAAFAVEQTVVAYHQVTVAYTPANGYFPLPAWAGLAVLGVWTAAAMALAVRLLARRDA